MSEQWMYRANGRDIGPVSYLKLQELAAEGGLSAESEVRSLRSYTWQVAALVDGLQFRSRDDESVDLRTDSNPDRDAAVRGDRWFCRVRESERGPLTFDELLEMARTRQVSADDEVRMESSSIWRRVGSIGRLMAALPYVDAGAPKTIASEPIAQITQVDSSPRQTSPVAQHLDATSPTPVPPAPSALPVDDHITAPSIVAQPARTVMPAPAVIRPTRVANRASRDAGPGLFDKLKQALTGEYAAHFIGLTLAGMFLVYWNYPRGPVRPVAIHPVKGLVVLNGQPLANAMICLYEVGEANAKVPKHTRPHGKSAPDGTFALGTFDPGDGAFNGNFVATVMLIEEKLDEAGEKVYGANLLPPVYARPETSPFKLKITSDTDELEPLELSAI